MSIRPYKDVYNRIDGALLVLVDTETVRKQEELRMASDFAEAILVMVREPLVILDGSLRVQKTNKAFLETFHVKGMETENHYLYELGGRQWDIPELRALLYDVLPKNTSFSNFVVEKDFPQLGRRTMLLNARRLELNANQTAMILLTIEDVTDRPIRIARS